MKQEKIIEGLHEISWKTVFNSAVADHYIWTDIGQAKVAAQKAGYKYFTWYQRVYSIATDFALPITTNDLDKK